MIIQQIRNATMRVTYGGKTFLVDPWLAPEGEPSPYKASHFLSRHTAAGSGDAPLCPLPFPADRILAGVDACVVTHIHPTHIDMDADGRPGGQLDRKLVMYVQNREDVRAFRRSGFVHVRMLSSTSCYRRIHVSRAPARSGTIVPCGPTCGVIFEYPGEKTLYLAGDTIWYEGVAETLSAYQPGVIVLSACAASLITEGRLNMDAADVAEVCRACPDAAIVITHMDAIVQAGLTRKTLRAALKELGLARRVLIPADGESLIF